MDKKIRKKKLFKLKSRLYSYSFDSEKGILELRLYSGSKKEPEIFVLSAFKKDLVVSVLDMIEKRSVKRFEVYFWVSTKCFNGRYYTNLILSKCEEWVTNKKKVELIRENATGNGSVSIGWGDSDF